MKRLLWVAIPALLAIGATAGCTTQPGAGGATPTPTPAPACPVGTWRTTSITANTTVSGVTVTFDGGADAAVTIGSDGATKADFTAMKPVAVATQVAGTQLRAEYFYRGSISGNVNVAGANSSATTTSTTTTTTTATATATTTSAPAGSKPWQPSGTANISDLRITVKLVQPLALTVVDNVKISEVTTAQTTQVGNAVDLQPLLRPGDYTCDGNDKLVITTTSGGPNVKWTLARGTVAGTTATTTPNPSPTK